MAVEREADPGVQGGHGAPGGGGGMSARGARGLRGARDARGGRDISGAPRAGGPGPLAPRRFPGARTRAARPWPARSWWRTPGARWTAVLTAVLALALAGLIAPTGHGGHGGSGTQPIRVGGGTVRQVSAPLPAQASAGCDLSSSLAPSSSDSGPAVQRIRKRGKLIAGIDTNSYLWGFRDPATGQLEGFDIDIVHAIAKAILGDPNAVEYLAIPTADRISALQSGEVDVVVRTMSITCERKRQVAFSVPYFDAGQELVVPDSSPIRDYGDDLRGKRVCTATGSTGEALLKQNAHGATEVPVANQLDCLVLMELGTVDATLTDNALGAGQAAQDPTVRLTGGVLTHEPYGVAMNKDATDLVRRVDQVLQDYRGQQWTASYDHWLRPRMGATSGPPQVTFTG